MKLARVIRSIDDLTIMDYTMASRIFTDSNVTSEFLSVILGKRIRIVRSYVQAQERPRKNAHYVTYDVLAYDDQGNIYNIEIQNYGEKDFILRLTYHEGILITKALKKGMEYGNLKSTTVVALCSGDPVGSDEIIYDSSFPFETYSSKKIESRSRIIVVNASGKKTSGNVDIDQLMNYIKTGKRNNGKLTILLDEARKRVCEEEKQKEAFMRELYQGMNETLKNMSEAERKQYQEDTLNRLSDLIANRLMKERDEKEKQGSRADEKDKIVKKEINIAIREEKRKSALRFYKEGVKPETIATSLEVTPEQLDEWLVSDHVVSYGEEKK